MPGFVVAVTVLKAGCLAETLRFTDSFIIGRARECGLQIKDPSVSRNHAKVEYCGAGWRLTDLASGNGTFIDGRRVQELPLPPEAVIELGKGGPQVLLVLEGKEDFRSEPATETQIMKHYFDQAKHDPHAAGERTLMFRRAFLRTHRKTTKKYHYAIAIVLLLLVAAGGTILVQRQKLQGLRATAEAIFYVMKSLQIQIEALEQVALLNSSPAQIAQLQTKRDMVGNLEKEYGNFLKELESYSTVSPEDRAIMRVAHLFGECEVNMPKGFSSEVKRYIAAWRSSGRLQKGLSRARQHGYTQLIVRRLKENNLPPQFLFLALQESGFDERAVGPATRFGNAKGMWQFLVPTARDLGLRIGPLHDQPVYDPLDDRFEPVKSTLAATSYLKGLNSTAAQASGLLVMASYNWGEGNVLKIIERMPPNPRERNFWRLLAMKDIPRETYDYVFSIFSAAVICEDPKLFGFDCDCPS